MWVPRVGVSSGSPGRRLGGRIVGRRNRHKVRWTCFVIRCRYMLEWPGWARKKTRNFASNKRLNKTKKSHKGEKTDSVSIKFPVFSFFGLDVGGA